VSSQENLHTFEVGEIVIVSKKSGLEYSNTAFPSFYIVEEVFAPYITEDYSYHNGSPYTVKVPQRLKLRDSKGELYNWGNEIEAIECWRPQEYADQLMDKLEKKREEILKFSDKALNEFKNFKQKEE
jgi:hypothetical protein